MPFIVVYDSNVLYPNTLRDLLIRLAQSGIVQAKWTDRILDEVFANIGKNRPDIDPAKLEAQAVAHYAGQCDFAPSARIRQRRSG